MSSQPTSCLLTSVQGCSTLLPLVQVQQVALENVLQGRPAWHCGHLGGYSCPPRDEAVLRTTLWSSGPCHTSPTHSTSKGTHMPRLHLIYHRGGGTNHNTEGAQLRDCDALPRKAAAERCTTSSGGWWPQAAADVSRKDPSADSALRESQVLDLAREARSGPKRPRPRGSPAHRGPAPEEARPIGAPPPAAGFHASCRRSSSLVPCPSPPLHSSHAGRRQLHPNT